jgi:hypothetical protein
VVGQVDYMKFKLVIPSLGRPKEILSHPLLDHAHVVVQPHEEELYKGSGKKVHVLPKEVKGIGRTRHWIVENLWDEGEDCIWMCDDDISGLLYIMSRTTRTYTDPQYIMSVLAHVSLASVDVGAGVCGFTRQSPQWRDSAVPFSVRDWSPSQIIGIVNRKLNFDQTLTTMEDIDIYIQGWQESGFNWTDNRWRPVGRNWNNRGGMQTYRTAHLQSDTLLRLKNKWGSSIIGDQVLNGKRPLVLLPKGR